MIQGWHGDDYLILFESRDELASATERYELASRLPGFTAVGLKAWDNLIVRDEEGNLFTIPTVPLDAQYLRPFDLIFSVAELRPDAGLVDRIRWHVQPLVFGGNPASPSNVAWLTLEQHAAAVKWWNQKYQELR